jgi:sodium pump decarboxylase gamma subunit
MLAEGFELMVAGMGVVFAFLTLMVVLMNGAAKFFETFAHWFEEEEQVVAPRPAVVKPSEDELASVAVAIAAAKKCANC